MIKLLFEKEIPCRGLWECSFVKELKMNNLFTDAATEARIISPSGAVKYIKGFYAGSNLWKIRFCPQEIGVYSCEVIISTSQMKEQSVIEFESKPSKNKGMLKVNPDYPHFFIYEDGTPIYLIGSGMEFQIPQLGTEPASISYYPDDRDPLEDWKHYLDMICESGFNRVRVFWGSVKYPDERKFTGQPCVFFEYRNMYERDSETGRYDLARFNTKAWDLLDSILQYGQTKGVIFEIVVFDRCSFENWKGRDRWEYNVYNELNGGPVPEMMDIKEEVTGKNVDLRHLQPDRKYNGKRGFFDIVEPYGNQEDWVFQMWNYYYQKLYVDYLIGRTAAYSNAYYEIINEMERPVGKWIGHWFKYFKDNEPYGRMLTCSTVCIEAENSDRLFEHFKIAACDIMSPHYEMSLPVLYELNKKYYSWNKPIVYDEVFWVKNLTAHGIPEGDKYYQERIWFWGNFVNGSQTCRVCWQPFFETPTFRWVKNFSSFIKGYEWWKMEPLFDQVTGTKGIDAYGCRIDSAFIVYVIKSQPVCECIVNILGESGKYKVGFFDPEEGVYMNTQVLLEGNLEVSLPIFERDLVVTLTKL